MKKIFKLFAALLTVSAMALSFASCSSDSDDDDPKAVYLATFSGDGVSEEYRLYLYDSDLVLNGKGSFQGESRSADLLKGTYTLTGDFKNGTISYKVTWVSSEFNYFEEGETGSFEVSDGKFNAILAEFKLQ